MSAVTSSSRKRAHREACESRRTRVRLSPRVESSGSEPSISDDSALVATSVPDEETGLSEVDSESESESELSESSEEPGSESDSESEEGSRASGSELEEQENDDGIINIRANMGKKPRMKLGRKDEGTDLRSFLDTFLPKIKAANAELEAQREAGTLKVIEQQDGEDEQYIEMDLGLGVLEEKVSNMGDSSSSVDTDTEEDGGKKERDILGKLMGKSRDEQSSMHKVEEVQPT